MVLQQMGIHDTVRPHTVTLEILQLDQNHQELFVILDILKVETPVYQMLQLLQ